MCGTESATSLGGRHLAVLPIERSEVQAVRRPTVSIVRHAAECLCLLICRRYQDLMPVEGMGQSLGPKIPIEQMFSDYVHTRGLSNWKFWIVS